MQKRLTQFAAAVVAGGLQVDEDGIHLQRKPADPEYLPVSKLRRALYASLSLGQIAGKILQIDSKLRFSCLLLGREPYNHGELSSIYAAVLNLGTALSGGAGSNRDAVSPGPAAFGRSKN